MCTLEETFEQHLAKFQLKNIVKVDVSQSIVNSVA